MIYKLVRDNIINWAIRLLLELLLSFMLNTGPLCAFIYMAIFRLYYLYTMYFVCSKLLVIATASLLKLRTSLFAACLKFVVMRKCMLC